VAHFKDPLVLRHGNLSPLVSGAGISLRKANRISLLTNELEPVFLCV
jgi:hypothetical protein